MADTKYIDVASLSIGFGAGDEETIGEIITLKERLVSPKGELTKGIAAINDKTILVDTGTSDQNKIAIFEIDYKNPITLLDEFGVKPSKITDVIITHKHWDHIDNIDTN